MSLLNSLLEFPLNCIYLLVDREAGNAYLLWSSGNSINQLSNIITLLRRGVHDNKLLQNAYNRGSLELEILKVYDKPLEDIALRAEACMLLQKSGYLDMSARYMKQVYRIQKRVMPDYRDLVNPAPLVYVTLKSRSVDAIVIAIFESMVEADEWLSKVYPDNIDSLVLCDNALTEGYHKAKGYKLIRFKEK